MTTKVKFKIKTKEGYVTPKEVSPNDICIPSFKLKINGRKYEFSHEYSGEDDTIIYDEVEKNYTYCDSNVIDRMYKKIITDANILASAEKIEFVYFEFDTMKGDFCAVGDNGAEYDGYFLELVSISFSDDEEVFISENVIKEFNKTQEDWSGEK